MVPSFRTNVCSHLAVHEKRITIVAPWTTEIHLVDTRVSCQSAAIEDISVSLVLGCRGCCDVRVGLAMNLALLKPCRSRTEDKVGSTFDIAVAE